MFYTHAKYFCRKMMKSKRKSVLSQYQSGFTIRRLARFLLRFFTLLPYSIFKHSCVWVYPNLERFASQLWFGF